MIKVIFFGIESKAPICVKYFYGICPTGDYCPYRHMKSKRAVVCKHWLRGLCKKGDDCEFRHQFDMTRMPECYFYAVNGLVYCQFFLACKYKQNINF